MPKFLDSTIAVSGASGHLGRRVVELLRAAGAKHVVAMTRDPSKLSAEAAAGLDVRAGSFMDPAGLTKALAGVERFLIISTDTIEDRARLHTNAIGAAEQAGVSHLAYTSLTSPYPDPTNPIADSHFWTEARLTASPLSWSILRNNQYADYLIPGAQHAIASGQHFHAASTGRRAFVTREDCAAAAVGALLDAGRRRIFDIGGPEALSDDDLAALYAQLSGRPVVAVNVPAPGLIAGLEQGGVPAGLASVLARFDTDTAKGYLGITKGDVEALTGRAPESVAAFLGRNLTALAA